MSNESSPRLVQRPTRPPGASARRPDIAATWKRAVADVIRRTSTLQDLSADSRYPGRRRDLDIASRGDLERVHAVLSAILADFRLFAGEAQESPAPPTSTHDTDATATRPDGDLT